MASYNFMKRADRDRCRADRQAEIDATRDGSWPRTLDDAMRWGATKTFYGTPEHSDYAAEMCQAEIDYLNGVEARIASGDDSVKGWEK